MVRCEFEALLKTNRESAIAWFMATKVDEWMNDGIEEVVRCLTSWAMHCVNLGDDDEILDMAEPLFEKDNEEC